MPDLWWQSPLITSAIGFLGVIVGALLTSFEKWWFSLRKDKKDARFLAVQVVFQLDRFVSDCANVATDDGGPNGPADSEGYYDRVLQISSPKFVPNALQLEWRNIPEKLMYEIFELPNMIESAEWIIEGALEHAARPDFDDYFEERQLQYANIGLRAAEIAVCLRKYARLPTRNVVQWDPIEHLRNRRKMIEEARATRQTLWNNPLQTN